MLNTLSVEQEVGCWALVGLALDSTENQELVVSSGGVEALVSAMRGHPQDAELQELGAWALKEVTRTVTLSASGDRVSDIHCTIRSSSPFLCGDQRLRAQLRRFRGGWQRLEGSKL